MHINLTQGTALELPPLIYLAGRTAITKRSSEAFPDNFIQQLLLIAKETERKEGKEWCET